MCNRLVGSLIVLLAVSCMSNATIATASAMCNAILQSTAGVATAFATASCSNPTSMGSGSVMVSIALGDTGTTTFTASSGADQGTSTFTQPTLLIIALGSSAFNEQYQVTTGPTSGFVLVKITADGMALSDGLGGASADVTVQSPGGNLNTGFGGPTGSCNSLSLMNCNVSGTFPFTMDVPFTLMGTLHTVAGSGGGPGDPGFGVLQGRLGGPLDVTFGVTLTVEDANHNPVLGAQVARLPEPGSGSLVLGGLLLPALCLLWRVSSSVSRPRAESTNAFWRKETTSSSFEREDAQRGTRGPAILARRAQK